MKTTEYLDAIKRKHGIQSDYAISKTLGISRQAISNYRKGSAFFDDVVCLKVAELLNLDPMKVIADIHMERTKDPEVRKIWRRLARQVGRAAAVVLLAGQVVTLPAPAQASVKAPGNSVYYVKSRRYRFRPLPAPVKL